jgi:hypothetical protein
MAYRSLAHAIVVVVKPKLRRGLKRFSRGLKRFSVVMVWWRDAAVTPGWHDSDKLETVGTNETLSCGFLVHRDRRRLLLALNLDKAGDSGHCLAIPRSQIIKVEQLRAPGRH